MSERITRESPEAPRNSVIDRDEPGEARETGRREGEGEIYALIDNRRLERECFIRSVRLLHPQIRVVPSASPDDYVESTSRALQPKIVIYNIGGREVTDPAVAADVRRLVDAAYPTSVVVLAEGEDLEQVLAAIDCGASGYIPASVGIDAIMEAAKLTASGGVFLTARSLRALRESVSPRSAAPADLGQQLTSRQAAVADALRRGKANKVIAYELNMCESTVKVHVRNIMKKVRASNRTEAAFKLNHLYLREKNAADSSTS